MNILVTGGAGFIGSHLCEYLLEKGDKVICVDNLFTGSKDNIEGLLENRNFKFIPHDIIEPLYLQEHVDQIYNLACPASPINYQFNAIRTIKANTIGMINMLGLAKRHKARILQASTSEVYGDPLEHPQKESYRGNVNTTGPRACFSEDTEILTKEGWKLFKDLKKTDSLLTLNSKKKIEYQKPIEIIKQKYLGDMILFKNKKIDLLVTPNHSMYVKKHHSNKFELIKAFESIDWGRANMQKSANWSGKEVKYFYFKKSKNAKSPFIKKIDMDVWLEFLGYYLSEGCVHIRTRKREINRKMYIVKDYNVLIAQDRKSKQERIRIKNCLQKTGFKFYESDDHQFRICNKHLAECLIKFGKSKEKYIPPEIKSLSKRQLKIIFNALMLGDGSKRGNAYYTASKRLLDDFQEILLKLGMTTGATTIDKRKQNPVYCCNILTNKTKNFLTPKYPNKVVTPYKGYVYCVSVPNKTLYVRRNFKPLFCGNCYDEGKRVAETLCFDYHRENNIDIRVARIFNTYGPKMQPNDGRVVSNFITQALKNEDITIYGNGNQTRSFCYVSDMIEGLYQLMNNDFQGPVNLGNPGEFTINHLAEIIINLTASKSKLAYKELPEDDPKVRQPDITLAKEKLRWEPRIPLEDGLKPTIEYFSKAI